MLSSLRRLLAGGLFLVCWAGGALAQTNSVICSISAVPPAVRSEGLAERFGDIALSCTGRAGEVVSGNLTVGLNTTVTNRISSGKVDVSLSIETPGGRSLLAQAELLGTNQVVFAGISFTVAANGRAELRISNLRGDATQGSSGLSTIQATLAFNPPSVLTMNGNQAVIGVPQRGLSATTLLTSVASQIGSTLPEELTFKNLLEEGTRFSSTRITEGFAGAFEPHQGTADTGTRIILRYTGYPSDARLFTPNVIIGSNGLQPTAAGDFGGTVSGGRYAPGSLALVRVLGTNSDGAGGYPASAPTGAGTFDEVSEIAINNGVGIAVYEVVDANPAAIESAQIPVFLGLPRTPDARTFTTGRDVYFGPASTVSVASSSQPVPRYKSTVATTDCSALSDCSKYVPKLEASPQQTSFTAVSGANFQMMWIPFYNIGGGTMVWTARVEYKNGSGWVRVSPTSGFDGNNLRLDVIPMGLAVGTYEATLIIDAGAAGVARYPVTLQVKPLPVPAPVISSIGGAATFAGPLTRGGLATIKGSNLSGADLSVTFNGTPARILYTSANQINFQVPSDLTGTTARVIVTANGVASVTQTVELTSVAPGIFPGGILNQDNRVNTAETPAASPSVVQIFATGLLPVQGDARVEVRFGDTYYSGSADLPYAGEAPGLPGVQQVNFRIPAGLATGSIDIAVCATPAGGTRACSPPVRLAVRSAQ